MLIDSFARLHNNLRISVTDRCNLRCTYCMPEEVAFLDRAELLTFEEMAHFVRVAAPLGIDKIRLTGGEPLLRRDLASLVRMLAAIDGVHDLGLTTNGILLADQAAALFDAGMRRVNVSLDTLDPGRFHEIARRGGLDKVLQGLDVAKKLGFAPIKINAVVVAGLNDGDVVPLARYARANGFEMRYIEYMPIGAEPWQRNEVFQAHQILDLLEQEVGALVPADSYNAHAPAMEFRYSDGGGSVGIIASVTRPFCHSCNRIRLTADGKLRNCLFALHETDIKPLLRTSGSEALLAEAIRASVRDKWAGHEFNTAQFIKPSRTMHAIGG